MSIMTAMPQGAAVKEVDLYGVCSTAASTVAKTVTVNYPGTLTLYPGLTINVKFNNRNGASSPTLNVNNTGAIPIVARSGENAAPDSWLTGEIRALTYDGSDWILQNGTVGMPGIYSTRTSVPANSSCTVNFNTNVSGMGLIITSGSKSAKKSLHIYGTDGEGNVNIVTIHSGNEVTFTSSGRVATFSNSNSGSLFIDVLTYYGGAVTITLI